MTTQEIGTAVTLFRNGYWCLSGNVVSTGIHTSFDLYADFNLGGITTDDLILDGMMLRFIDAGDAAGNDIRPDLLPNRTTYAHMENFVTARSPECKTYTPLGIPIMPRRRSSPVTGSDILLQFQFDPVLAANDNLRVFLWGRVPVRTLSDVVQPVSVEAYKWPLTRR